MRKLYLIMNQTRRRRGGAVFTEPYLRSILLAVLVGALLACKEGDEARAARAERHRVKPGESPAEILARADTFGLGAREFVPVRVTGIATECSCGTQLCVCVLDAGEGRVLRALMKQFMSPVGVSHEDPPAVGMIATMLCEELNAKTLNPSSESHPILRNCTVLHREP